MDDEQHPDDHAHEQQPKPPPAHVVVHGGHSFNRKRLSRHHTTYWCKHARTESCPVKLKIFVGKDQIEWNGVYTDGCQLKNRNRQL